MYGLTTKPPERPSICGAAGWLAVRARTGRFYSGEGITEKYIGKVHPGSTVHFRLDLSKGTLTAWVNDEAEVVLVCSRRTFARKTWFPGVGCCGPASTVRLASCQVLQVPMGILQNRGRMEELRSSAG